MHLIAKNTEEAARLTADEPGYIVTPFDSFWRRTGKGSTTEISEAHVYTAGYWRDSGMTSSDTKFMPLYRQGKDKPL